MRVPLINVKVQGYRAMYYCVGALTSDRCSHKCFTVISGEGVCVPHYYCYYHVGSSETSKE